MHISPRLRRGPTVVVAVLALLASLLAHATTASAGHPEASFPGSNFEIDDNANLVRDDPPPSTDWATLAHPDGPELRATDQPTGQSDDSYKGGTKEDTECPDETTGSIPNNKSDLLTFHVYQEEGAGGHPGFLNLAWSRVSDPSGTTLMDFEFNQSETPCAAGPNKVRTEGDLLIEYAIDQGGSRAEISGRFWSGTAWGAPIDLDDGTGCGGGPCATGTINQTVIAAADSDGLGEKQARTFGEAQIDLRLIFDDQSCTSFGSAMLKSRASDSFTSQLKDFIRPIDIDLQNCARVIIRKQTLPDEDPNATEFGYTKSFATDPTTPNTFTLTDDGVQDYGQTVLFGAGYTVVEDVIPAAYVLDGVDCAASSGVTPSISGATVTFDIDAAGDVLDCTYTNRRQLGAIEITKTRKHAAAGSGDHPHAGVTFTVTGGDLPADGVTVTTGANGVACVDDLVVSAIAGDYTVTEALPSGYSPDGDLAKTVTVTEGTCASDPVPVSFANTPLTDLDVVVNSQVDGGTASTVSCVDSADAVVAAGSTDANGDATVGVDDLLPGTYVCTVIIDP